MARFVRMVVEIVAPVFFISIVCFWSPVAKARDLHLTQKSYLPPGSVAIAQADGDDSYDPFADYSEFEQSMDEEEDINFFRNGRLFTVGFVGGYRGFTQTLSSIYTPGPNFGLNLSFFFDLRFALQIGFLTGDHALTVKGPSETISGNVGLTDLSFNLKYYFNTQNVTRGLAELNPFLIGGFSQIYRTYSVAGNGDFSKDAAFAFNAGGGIEIPMLRNKMYFGLQASYQLVNFADENKVLLQSDGTKTGVVPRGDSFLVLGILGVNF